MLASACPTHHPLFAATDVERGAIYTKREVVEAILDLVGYAVAKPLHLQCILEPASGKGDFLFPTVERLLTSFYDHGGRPERAEELGKCILAVEVSDVSHVRTKESVRDYLVSRHIPPSSARKLIDQWFLNADFLLTPIRSRFDYVVGNPPYIRQERIPAALLREYRARYPTLYDRADIYVPFIERSLNLLAPGGHLGFICADRWLKNKYGGPLRNLVSLGFHLKYVLNMDSVESFTSEVIAYPAIFVIENSIVKKPTRLGVPPRSFPELQKTVEALLDAKPSNRVQEVGEVVSGKSPWLVESGGAMGVLRQLEDHLPTLEDAGCKVGIGVATGADNVFIGPLADLPVEDSRKLPLVTTRDILTGEIVWRGLGVVNPFDVNGKVVSLEEYPKFKQFVETNEVLIKRRNVAKRSGAGWYRTIDRIYPHLVRVPKLLIPDIKGRANVVFDAGNYYPHHNLYYVTSDAWELRALQAVLASSVTRLFIASYSTKMRGGFFRYQAQYLRRIRIPKWADVSSSMRSELAAAATANNLEMCNSSTLKLYGLSASDVQI